MSELTIITNNVPRNLIYGSDLTDKEKTNFDYISAEDFDTHNFFRYKGQVYDPSEFSVTPIVTDEFSTGTNYGRWHGYTTHTFFSGILIRYTSDMSQVIVGRYYS